MHFKKVLIGVAAISWLATTGVALADHGKVGLWDISTKMTMPGMGKEQIFRSQHCMTAKEVKQDAIPPSNNAECKMINQKMTGHSFSGDMVCSGPAKGSGHILVSYDSDSHYAGRMTMSMDAGGRAMTMTNAFEGKWISVDCGKVGR